MVPLSPRLAAAGDTQQEQPPDAESLLASPENKDARTGFRIGPPALLWATVAALTSHATHGSPGSSMGTQQPQQQGETQRALGTAPSCSPQWWRDGEPCG